MAISPVKNFISDDEFAQMMGGGSTGGPMPSTPTPQTSLPSKDDGFSATQMVKNIPSSAGKFVGDIGKAVFNPIDTATGLLKIGTGAISKLIPGRQATEDNFDAVVDFYKQRYGGVNQFLDSLEKDPVGVASDVSALLGAGGAAIKLASTATKSASLAKTAGTLSKASRVLDPAIQGANLATKIPGVNQIAQTIKFLPERLIRSATGQSKAEILAGKDVSKFVIKNKRIGSAQDLINSSAKNIDTLENSIDGILRNNSKSTAREVLFKDFANSSNVARNAQLDAGTVAVQIAKAYPQTRQLLSKKVLTTSEINRLRKILDRSVGDAAFLSTNEGAFGKELAKDFSNHLRSQVQSNAPETAKLFDDYEMEINLKDSMESKFAQGSRNQVLTFGDLIGGGLGTAFGGPMGAIAGVAARRTLQSTPVLTASAVGLDRIGKILNKLDPVERANMIRFMRSLSNTNPDEQPQAQDGQLPSFIPDGQFQGSMQDFKIISMPEEMSMVPGLPDAGGKGNLPQRNNNPLNIKYGGATKKWVEQGLAELSDPGKDGGRFLKFTSKEAGFKAAQDLLTSKVYSGLSVDQAMRKWSNKGYGGEIAPKIKTKRIGQLTEAELSGLVQRMAKREGFYA